MLGQLPASGFTVREFIELYQMHLSHAGRTLQRKDTIRSKLKYQYQAGLVVRKKVWQGEDCWVEMTAGGQEIREMVQEFGMVLPARRPLIQEGEEEDRFRVRSLEEIAEEMRLHDLAKGEKKEEMERIMLQKAEKQLLATPQYPPEPEEGKVVESTEDVMKRLGYG